MSKTRVTPGSAGGEGPERAPLIVATEAEKIIRKELRSLRDLGLRVTQWGVTVLISIQTAIFFLRKDVYERMRTDGELVKGQYLPMERYLLGTLFLVIAATIFYLMTVMVSKRYQHYVGLFEKLDPPPIVRLPPSSSAGRIMIFCLYFAFPIFDVFVRMAVRFELH